MANGPNYQLPLAMGGSRILSHSSLDNARYPSIYSVLGNVLDSEWAFEDSE